MPVSLHCSACSASVAANTPTGFGPVGKGEAVMKIVGTCRIVGWVPLHTCASNAA